MKQVFGVFLSLIYLLLIVGVPISVHHCNGAQATNISLWSLAACSCSVEPDKDNTCCAIADEAADSMSASCGASEFEESCCSNQKEIISWNPDQQMISFFYMVFSEMETELFISSDKILDIHNVLIEKPDGFGLSPPFKPSKIILQHQFIFYA